MGSMEGEAEESSLAESGSHPIHNGRPRRMSRGGFLVEVIGRSLGMRGSRKNGAVVVLEDFEPCCDIGGVVLPRFLVQFEIGAQESRSQLGNEFLAAVTFVAPDLAPEVAVKTLRVFCPVRLMPMSA